MITKKYYVTSEKATKNDTNIFTLPTFDTYNKAFNYIERQKKSNKFGKWLGIQVIKNKNGKKYTGLLDKFYL